MPEFYMIFAPKINKIPEFYMIYAPKINKMPKFYMIFAQKMFFPNFGGQVPPPPRGVYRGGSGRNLRPVWLKGGKNSTLKGGRIPPSRGE